MTGVKLRTAGVRIDGAAAARAFVQAFFENDYAALIESWTLSLERRSEAWTVVRQEITGNDDPALQDPHPRCAGRAGPSGRGQSRGHPSRLRGRGRLLRQHPRPRNGPGRRRSGPGRFHALRPQREAPAGAPLQAGADRGRGRVPLHPLLAELLRHEHPYRRGGWSGGDQAGRAGQGRSGLRPELSARLHYRELLRREAPVLHAPGRRGRAGVQGPQGRGDGLYLLPVRRRRSQPLRPRQGTGRLPLQPGPGRRAPAEEDVHLVRGEVRRQCVLARPELRPGQFLHLGSGPHRGPPPGRPPRDAQVPLQSRFRDPQDHGPAGPGVVLHPGPGSQHALRPFRRAPGREGADGDRGLLPRFDEARDPDDGRRLPDRLGRRQHPRPAPLRDLLLFPRRFLVPGPGRGGLLPGPPDPRRPARIRVRRQRGAGGPGPAGGHGRRRGDREGGELHLHVRLPLAPEVHVVHHREVRRPEGPARPRAPRLLRLLRGHGLAPGPPRPGRRHPRFLRPRLRPVPLRKAGRRPQALAGLRGAQPGLVHRPQRGPLVRRFGLSHARRHARRPVQLGRVLPGPRDRPPVVGPGRFVRFLQGPVAERRPGPVRGGLLSAVPLRGVRLRRHPQEVLPLDRQEIAPRPDHSWARA